MFYKLCCDFWILSFNTQILYKIQKWIHFHVILNKRYNNKQVLIQTRCGLPKVSSCCLYQQRTVEHQSTITHHTFYVLNSLLSIIQFFLLFSVMYDTYLGHHGPLPCPDHILSLLCVQTLECYKPRQLLLCQQINQHVNINTAHKWIFSVQCTNSLRACSTIFSQVNPLWL